MYCKVYHVYHLSASLGVGVPLRGMHPHPRRGLSEGNDGSHPDHPLKGRESFCLAGTLPLREAPFRVGERRRGVNYR